MICSRRAEASHVKIRLTVWENALCVVVYRREEELKLRRKEGLSAHTRQKRHGVNQTYQPLYMYYGCLCLAKIDLAISIFFSLVSDFKYSHV